MTGAFRRSILPVWLATALALCAPRVAAQTEEDRAAARALATQGITAYGDGRYAEAIDLFSRAESLLHAPPHVLYMARAAAKLGQLVRARELYLKLGREELPANAPQAFRDAQSAAREEVRAIEPRLASLTINIKPVTGLEPASVKVEMDGKAVSSAVIGVAFPADPGQHKLIATAPGYRSQPAEVSLSEGGRGTVELSLQPSPASSATPPGSAVQSGASNTQPATTTATMDSARLGEGSPGWMRPTSYVAMGVGVLGIGAGTFFGLKSRSTRKQADDLAAECGSDCLASDPLASAIDEKDDTARRQLTYSIVGFVVGGVGAATGVTLFVLSQRKPRATASTLVPYVGLGTAGLRGTW